jgi:hypothetical protein
VKTDYSSARARRGFALMAALAIIAVLVFNLDVVVERFRGHIDVVAIVTETSDVRAGASVWVEGVEVGHVRSMALVDARTLAGMADRLGDEDRAAIALHLRLEDRVRDIVRQGSRAYTARQRVIGAPTVRIEAGPPEAPPVETGDTLYPVDRPSVETLIEMGKAFPTALDSLVVGVRTLNRLAGEQRPGVRRLMDRIEVVTEEAAILTADLEGGSIGRWLGDPELGRRVESLQRRVAALGEAGQSLQRYGAADGELARSGEALMARADRLGEALDRLEARLAAGDGVLTRAARDSALAVALSRVQAQVDSLRAEGMGFGLRMIVP